MRSYRTFPPAGHIKANVGSGADNVGREHSTESMIVGQNKCSIASRTSN
jgi:hypothetical protein